MKKLLWQEGEGPVDDAIAAFLWERSHGNPRNAVELVRFLRDRSLLQVRAGRVVAPPPGVSLLADAVPEGLAQLALARLEVGHRAAELGQAGGLGVVEHLDDLGVH